MPWEYLELRRQLVEVRKLMVEAHGTPEHDRLKLIARGIEEDMEKALSRSKESA